VAGGRSVGGGDGDPGVVSYGTTCAPTPTASLTTAIHTPQHTDMTGQTLIAPLVIHDKATVTTTVNAIPAGRAELMEPPHGVLVRHRPFITTRDADGAVGVVTVGCLGLRLCWQGSKVVYRCPVPARPCVWPSKRPGLLRICPGTCC
jgi:hypothetical protein